MLVATTNSFYMPVFLSHIRTFVRADEPMATNHPLIVKQIRDFNLLKFTKCIQVDDRLCGLVVRVLDYRCRGPGLDSRALRKKK
jgi:hypothetical protein